MQALFIGMALSITAIAVNARVLNDMNLIQYRVTPVIIGASIIDDILSLILFTIIIDFASGGGSLNGTNLVILIVKVTAFFGISHVIGIMLYPKFSRYFSSREAKGFTFALIMALFFGVLAEMAGLHIILGAYMAGLFVRPHHGIVLWGPGRNGRTAYHSGRLHGRPFCAGRHCQQGTVSEDK
jgi:Kef-type K+ transport system membrane component KefB